MASEPSLPPLGVKRLQQPLRFPLTACCDVHDLLAVVLHEWDIDVFRLANAQVAFTVKRKDDDCTVVSLRWKPDGSFLAVAWSDGTYGLYSGENGRLISLANIRADTREDDWRLDLRPDFGPDDDESNGSTVTCLGWTIQDGRDAKEDGPKISLSTDDWYDGFELNDSNPSGDDDSERWTKRPTEISISELVRSITTLDVTKALPRLSAIPAHQMPFAKAGPGGNKFASQTATDGIFHPPQDVHVHLVQSLFVCEDDGNVQLLVDETVKVGSCHVNGRPFIHMSHPQSPCHAILAETPNEDVQINYIHLPLNTLSGPLLHVIATNTKRIQNLIDYIAHTVRCIEHDFTTGRQLPGRLLNNLNESLSEKEEGTAVYNLYHLAMTGDFSPTMLEWLVDIVKETNHKRWDQTVGTMYTNIQNHVFMNLLPAIDRLSIAITTLRGHANFHKGSTQFDVPPEHFSHMLDAVDSMRIVAQKMQLILMTETKQFRTFSKWLRIYIEIGVAEPFSRSAIETEERELPSLDYALLLAYIKDTMTNSGLASYISPRPGMVGGVNKEEFFKNPVIHDMSYEGTLAALSLVNDDKPVEVKDVTDSASLLNLPSVTVALLGRARVVLQHITTWQSRMLPSPIAMTIPISRNTIMDTASTSGSFHLLTYPPRSSPPELCIITVSPSHPAPNTAIVPINLPDPGSRILDARFQSVAPTVLLLLVQQADVAVILRFSVESSSSDLLHSFPDSSFKAEHLFVGGRRRKPVCVVFGNGGKEWRAFALNSASATSTSLAGPSGPTVDEEWEDEDAMVDI